MKKILTVFLSAALFSCGPKEFNLSSQTTNVELGDSVETDSIVINGSDGNCTVDYQAAWLKAELQDSVLVYTAEVNATGNVREDSIVVRCGASTISFPVMQFAKATKLELPDGKQFTFPKEGGEKVVQALSDGLVKVDSPDSLVQASWKDGKLTVSAPKNDGLRKKAIVSLTAGDIKETVTFIIDGESCKTCGGTGKVNCSKCQGAGYYTNGVDFGVYGCKACGGRGYCYGQYDEGFRNGAGKKTCPTCGGQGF